MQGFFLKRIIFLSAVASSLVFGVESEIIKSIEFKNLNKISIKIANEIVNQKANEAYDAKKVTEAIKNFYKYGYFDDVWVELDDKKNLIFNFKEKPSIAKLSISGYKTREEDLDLLYSQMGVKKGSMYTEQRIAEAKEKLLKELEKEGYINSVVEVDTENISSESVAVTFNVNKGDEIVITKANYFGAKNLEVDDFEGVTANKAIDWFPWFFGQNDGELKIAELEYDGYRINDLYYQNGYLDALVKRPAMLIDFKTNEAGLDYFIAEGTQYHVGDIKIFVDTDIVDPLTLYPELKLVRGKSFNVNKLRKDVEFIKTKVGDKGYAFADVKYDIKKDPKTGIADVVFNVIPNDKVYINDVIISGNSRTLDRVIRRSVYLAPGDLFSSTDFQDSKGALRRSGYFDDVNIEQRRVSSDKVDLLINVKEAATGTLIVGGGYGSYDGFMLNASVNDKNIFGSGMNLGFSIDYSEKKNNYTISLANPSIYDTDYSGNFSIYRQESTVTETDDEYTVTRDGFSVGAGKMISRFTSVGATYKLESVEEIHTVNTTENDDYLLSSITPYINFNNTDDYYVPRNGYQAGASMEFAGIGGDSQYLKSSVYLKYFKGLEDLTDHDIIFRYKARVRDLEDLGKISDGDGFYLGGPSSVRGYESYAFGAEDGEDPYTKYFANSFELSFPLVPSAKMRWATFFDYGMIGEKNFTEITKSGYGVLFEWFSPVGPLQFIFSKAISPDPDDKTSSFEFNLGGTF